MNLEIAFFLILLSSHELALVSEETIDFGLADEFGILKQDRVAKDSKDSTEAKSSSSPQGDGITSTVFLQLELKMTFCFLKEGTSLFLRV